jgi:hypothetical protein
LVAAVEAALGTKVKGLRYLPSPTAAAAALANALLRSAEHAVEVALDDLLDVGVAQPGLGGMVGTTKVDLPPDDESAG